MATGRDRDRDRDTGSRSRGKAKKRASLSHTQSEQYGLVDNFNFTIRDAWYGPWIMKAKDGTTYDPVLALWTEYYIEDEDKIHVEPISMGRSSLKYYAPSKTGYEDEYAGELSREDWLEIGNGNVGNYDMDELRGGHLLPLSSRKTVGANSGADFFIKTLIASAEANGVALEWEDEDGDRDIGDVLRGLQGHASRLKNDLQKDMDFGDGDGTPKKDRKVLVIVEVSGFEKGGKKPAGGSRKPKEEDEQDDRSSRRPTSRRVRDEDDEPEEDTHRSGRGRRGSAEEDEDEPQGRGRAGSRSRDKGGDREGSRDRGKKPAGPDFAAIVKDREFLGAYFDEVADRVERSKGKKVQRAGLVEISDFEDQEWNETAFELATSDDKWVIDFWERRREVDYDDTDGMVRLAK